MGAICGTETWHRNTDDALTLKTQLIESLDGYQQSQRRVKTSTDAYHSLCGIDMIKALGKSCYLNIQDLLTGGLHVLSLGNKRMRINLTLELKLTRCNGFTSNLSSTCTTLGIDKRGV